MTVTYIKINYFPSTVVIRYLLNKCGGVRLKRAVFILHFLFLFSFDRDMRGETSYYKEDFCAERGEGRLFSS